MKISELIKELKNKQKLFGDLEVMTTWESISREINTENIYSSHHNCLYIDADRNSYKEQFTNEI